MTFVLEFEDRFDGDAIDTSSWLPYYLPHWSSRASAAARVGIGVHPFGDPEIRDEFSRVTIPIDARDFHVYAAEWTTDQLCFFVEGQLVKRVEQSPGYPMQLMLSIYEFRADDGHDRGRYPKEFQVDYVRVHAL